jgi:hypothetical protein
VALSAVVVSPNPKLVPRRMSHYVKHTILSKFRTTMSQAAAESGDEPILISPLGTQFVPQDGDEEALWEVIEITAEKPTKYKVKWAGTDPATGKPWPESWVLKHDCTDKLVRSWKREQARKKQRRGVGKKKGE